jgi:hypothetical protein
MRFLKEFQVYEQIWKTFAYGRKELTDKRREASPQKDFPDNGTFT